MHTKYDLALSRVMLEVTLRSGRGQEALSECVIGDASEIKHKI